MTRNNKHKDLCVMGDFNCVESDIDRSPPHKDNDKIVASLRKITTRNKLIDVWGSKTQQVKASSFKQAQKLWLVKIEFMSIKTSSTMSMIMK